MINVAITLAPAEDFEAVFATDGSTPMIGFRPTLTQRRTSQCLLSGKRV
ncbi:MAG TPA: hypothetical protein VL358_09535 [Caulobacteraceae bacterium]|nr:hypothetical protein [Caulobacteraceae bacterium]